MKRSISVLDKRLTFSNKSPRIVSIALLATLEAIRFAATLNTTARTEQKIMKNPHKNISGLWFAGITVSII